MAPHRSIILNIHNYELSSANLRDINLQLQRDLHDAHADPLRVHLLVAGDFNFLHPGEQRLSHSSPQRAQPLLRPQREHRPGQAALQPLLDQLTELAQPQATYYDAAAMLVSRLDRVYSSLPGFVLTKLHMKAFLTKTPEAMQKTLFSDHAPVHCTVTAARLLPAHARPIAAAIF